MSKTEVYSWRVSAGTKAGLEHEARQQGVSLAGLLERISSDWLQARGAENGADAAEQRRLHAKAAKLLGSIDGGGPGRAARSREIVRERLSRLRQRTRVTTRLGSAGPVSSERRPAARRYESRKPVRSTKRPARRS
jgi:hypothetical protein